MNGTYHSDLKVLVKAERKVAARMNTLCGRLNRIDELDEEQRSEMYTILQALKHDEQFHLEALDALLAAQAREAADV